MKRGFLQLQILQQLLEAIQHFLIGQARLHETVMQNLRVDLVALVTHDGPSEVGEGPPAPPVGHSTNSDEFGSCDKSLCWRRQAGR